MIAKVLISSTFYTENLRCEIYFGRNFLYEKLNYFIIKYIFWNSA